MRKPATLRGAGGVLTMLVLGLAVPWSGVARAQEPGEPWLGVTMQALDGELREGMNYAGKGVLISRVTPGSPADKAGLRKGDIVVSLNSRSVDSPEGLARLVRESRVGATVKLAIVRNGTRRNLEPRLAARPEDLARDEQREAEPPDLESLPSAPFEGDAPEVFLHAMGRGRLGVRVGDLNRDLGPYFSLPEGQGALVLEVLKDTPAERVGIKAGDVITQVGERKVADADDLTREIRRASEGKVALTLMRKGTKRTIEVELGAAPRAIWHQRGMGPMSLGDGDRVVIRRRFDGDLRDELRQLREELRELREKLDKLEHD